MPPKSSFIAGTPNKQNKRKEVKKPNTKLETVSFNKLIKEILQEKEKSKQRRRRLQFSSNSKPKK